MYIEETEDESENERSYEIIKHKSSVSVRKVLLVVIEAHGNNKPFEMALQNTDL